jgi:hypothetical protein
MVGVNSDLFPVHNKKDGTLVSVACHTAEDRYFCQHLWKRDNLHNLIHPNHWQVCQVTDAVTVYISVCSEEFFIYKFGNFTGALFLNFGRFWPLGNIFNAQQQY